MDFNPSHDGGSRRTAIGRFELYPIPAIGIVAGREYDGTGRLPRHHSIAYCGRRCGAISQCHRNAGSRHHFTRVLGKLCGKKARVVTHHEALCRVTLLADVLRDGFGDASHVGKGKIFRDYTAPSIGAELNLIQHRL